jgi:hypothetical protein
MGLRGFILAAAMVFAAVGLLNGQNPFRQFRAAEYLDFPLPSDWNTPAEFTRARLKYTAYGRVHIFDDVGGGALAWSIDYPRTDRHFLQGLRRLTRIDARSVEQVVELDNTDDVYNWPFLYAVEPGHWTLNDEEADQLRDFLLRGGFLMTDDFHGTLEWEVFMEGLHKVFPDRPVVDIDNKDPIFHVIYNLGARYQVPGKQFLYSGSRYEYDGFDAKWRAVYDDKGRIIAAICHNMDLGDAIEHSDEPEYPEPYSALAYRIVSNYVMYDLTH